MGFRALRLLAAVLLAATLATTGAACTSHKEKRDPVLAGDLVAGGSYDPATYKGKVTVVNFWGSWCAPCRAEMPGLVKAYDELNKDGVAFLGVNVRDPNVDLAISERRDAVSAECHRQPPGQRSRTVGDHDSHLHLQPPPSSIDRRPVGGGRRKTAPTH